ncbi:MAG TPA: hypothetical protein VG013_25285 [Gemmataceae bacterium]|nr:hypothetical protein [Gemmataceae bacterium]
MKCLVTLIVAWLLLSAPAVARAEQPSANNPGRTGPPRDAAKTTERLIARLRGVLLDHEAACGAFSPDGELLAAGGDAGQVRVWGARTGKQRVVVRHGEPVVAVEFWDDGKRLTTSGESHMRQWDTATGKEINREEER